MAAIATLSLNLVANVKGWNAGLKAATNGVDRFYADIAKKVGAAASPVTGALKAVGNFAANLKGLAASVVAPLGRAVEGIKKIGGAAIAVGGIVVDFATTGVRILGSMAAAAVGVAGSIAGVGLALAHAGLERIDVLTDQAARIGVTTKALSELRYAANLTGSSAEDLDVALEKLNTNLGDAIDKGTPASNALERLGLSARTLANQAPDATFRQIVAGFEKVPNAAERASLAMDIFGKGGIKILNTLGAGSGELDRLAGEARKFGVSISLVDATKIGAAKDALDRMGAAVEGLGNQLAIKLAPVVELAANKIADFVAGGVDGGKNVERALDALAGGVGRAADGFILLGAFAAEGFGRASLAIGKTAFVLSMAFRAVSSLSPTFAPVADALAGVADKTLEIGVNSLTASAQMAKAFRDGKASKAIQDGYNQAKAAAQSAAEQAPDNSGASATDRLGSSVAELTAKLREQAAVWGMTAAEADIYKLKAKGATDAQLGEARAIADRLKVLDLEKKASEDEAKAAQDYWKNTRTAAETYAQEVEKINLLQSKGLLDEETAKRATGKAAKDAGVSDQSKFAGATELASSGGYSMIVSALSGRGSGMNEVVKSGREQVKAQGTTNGLLTKLVNRATTPPAPQLLAI